MTEIDRRSPVPIYHQLKLLILENIEHGRWRPGDRVPTERELCETYHISRSPVRQALSELAQEGVLRRRRGSGTFVSRMASNEPARVLSIKMMCSDPHWHRVLEQGARVWNREHPERQIAFDIQVVDHSQFYDRLHGDVGRGGAPDVAMIDCVWVAGLAKAGFIYPLERLGFRLGNGKSNNAFFSTFVEANSYRGALYGLPVKADVSVLWYRKDWFEVEGLSPPRDWDDLLTTARHFLKPEVQERYGLVWPLVFCGGRPAGEATVYSLMPFIWSAGGSVFDDGQSAVRIDSLGTWQALQFLRELVNRHGVSPADVATYKEDVPPKLFARGEAAMSLGGSYEGELIREVGGWDIDEFTKHVGYVVPPAAPSGERVSAVGGTSYVILRQCEYPELVLDVLEMAVDPAVVGEQYRSMLQNSPSPSFYERLDVEEDSILSTIATMIASSRARPPMPEYFKISHQLEAMFEAAIIDAEPISEITNRTAQFISVISEKPCVHG